MPPAIGALGKENRRVVLATVIGTTIEWYDFFIYALCAGLVFGDEFFDTIGGDDSLLVSFSTVGISFLFRPVGAVIAGHLGDRLGRKTMLILTLFMMGGATVLVGAVPNSASIGVAAPIILILLRIVQGLSAGGEWGGAAMLAVEHAPTNRRGFLGSFPQIGVPIGLVLANGILALVTFTTTPDQFQAWGWRLPFLFSAVLIAVGAVIRSRVAESPVFEEVQQNRAQASLPIVPLFKNHWKLVLLGALVFAANNAAGYMTTGGYVQNYTTDNLGMDSTMVLVAVVIGALAWLVTTLLGGRMADTVGRVRTYQIGFVIQLIAIFPFFALINVGSMWALVLSLLLFSIGLGLTYGPQSALFAEMYPTHVRYSGASISYALGAVLGGAFAPMIATALESGTGTIYSVGVYLSVLTIIGLVAAFFIRDNAGRTLGSGAEDQSGAADSESASGSEHPKASSA